MADSIFGLDLLFPFKIWNNANFPRWYTRYNAKFWRRAAINLRKTRERASERSNRAHLCALVMGQIAGTLSTFNGPGRVCLSRVAAGKMAPHYGRRIDYTALIGLHQVELLQTMRGCLLIRGSTSTGALLNGLAGGREAILSHSSPTHCFSFGVYSRAAAHTHRSKQIRTGRLG